MNPDAFLDLMEAVEDAGGAHLTEVCVPRRYKLAKRPDTKPRVFYTSGCGNAARFVVPYKGMGGQDLTLIACAVDDWMDRWPRFKPGHEGEPLVDLDPDPTPEDAVLCLSK